MKFSFGPNASVRKVAPAASAIALLHFGMAMCIVMPLPSRAQSIGSMALPASMLYVNCAAGSRGDGSARHPYWRITDALETARVLGQRSPRPVTISVAAGICSGNFETQPIGQRTRPPELLPLVLNVPDLTLHGAGVMEYTGGYPAAPRVGTATTVTVDTLRLSDLDNTVIYVGPTKDGGRADGTVIEGLVIDNQFNSQFGIFINRTQRITILNNVVEHVNFGAINGSECSGWIVGNVVHDGAPGMVFAAGTAHNPSRLYIGDNTATNNYEGVAFFGASMATERLDMGANTLEVLPYPISPTAGQLGNHIEVEFEGNDVSNNDNGLQFTLFGGGHYPYLQTVSMKINVHDNRFVDNFGYPFSVDSGFVFRGTSEYWTNPDPADFPIGYLGSLATPFITHGPFDGPYSADVSAIFEDNIWKSRDVVPTAPAILTFSYIDVYDAATGVPDPSLVLQYSYLRNSRLNFVDEDGLFSQPGVIRDDLRPYDPFDGVALLNQTHIRR